MCVSGAWGARRNMIVLREVQSVVEHAGDRLGPMHRPGEMSDFVR